MLFLSVLLGRVRVSAWARLGGGPSSPTSHYSLNAFQ